MTNSKYDLVVIGAGPGGLLVSAREYGYYGEYSSNKLMRGFLPTSLVENNYESLFSDSANIDNIYPAVRIKPDTAVNTGMRGGTLNGNIMGTHTNIQKSFLKRIGEYHIQHIYLNHLDIQYFKQ